MCTLYTFLQIFSEIELAPTLPACAASTQSWRTIAIFFAIKNTDNMLNRDSIFMLTFRPSPIMCHIMI